MNGTNCGGDEEFKYALYTMTFSVVFVLGLLLNAVALYIFTCALKQRNETATYMLNLVVCDSLFVVSLPLQIFYFIKRNWPFGPVLCKISVMLFFTNMYGSVLFLTCICADRFLAIVHPFAYRALRTKRYAKMASAAVWLTVLSVSLSSVVHLQLSSRDNVTYCFEKYDRSQWESGLSKVVVVMETLGFAVPLLINIFCSGMIFRTVRNIGDEGRVNKTKVLCMIAVHLLIFCLCFVPYNVNLVFYTLVRSKSITDCAMGNAIEGLYPVTLCIAVTNCCFDPVIYYFTSETIQKSFKRRSGVVQTTIRLRTTTRSSEKILNPIKTALNATDCNQ